jgi:hypothetical protein
MGGTNSILQQSLRSVAYVPPDLTTLNNNNHNMTTSSKRKNSKSRRQNLIMYSSSSSSIVSPRNPASSPGAGAGGTSGISVSDELDQQQLIHEILHSNQLLQSSPAAAVSSPSNSNSHLSPRPTVPPLSSSSPLAQQDPSSSSHLRHLLTKVIQNNFFYFNNLTSLQLEMLLTVIQHKHYSATETIFSEGDPGSTLYIIDTGEVAVLINQVQVRTLTTGQIFGEIGLLFNSNRTATIRCLTDCSLFLIHRRFYKNIQKLTNTASILQRNRWLLSCPELVRSNFTPIHMSRLFSTLKHIVFHKDDVVYEEGKETNYVLLIERGRAIVTVSPSTALLLTEGLERRGGGRLPSSGEGEEGEDQWQQQEQTSGERMENLVGILRPKNWKNIDSQSPKEFLNTFYHRAASTVISEEESEGGGGAEEGEAGQSAERRGSGFRGDASVEREAAAEAERRTQMLSSYLSRQESLPPVASTPTSSTIEFEVLHEGCIIGLPILHASANKADEKSWRYVRSPFILPRHTPLIRRSSTLQSSSSFAETTFTSPRGVGGGESKTASAGGNGGGSGRREGYVLSPITVVALTELQCSIFTIAAFERAFGPLSSPSSSTSSSSPPPLSSSNPPFTQLSHAFPSSRPPTQLQTIPSESHLPSTCSSKDYSPMLGSSFSASSAYGFGFPTTNLPPSHPFTDLSSFHYLKILGVGGFGTVLLATYKSSPSSPSSPSASSTSPPTSTSRAIESGGSYTARSTTNPSNTALPTHYAVKIMSKEWVAQKGQVKHVLDESKILRSFTSPFILHLYGTFQTKHWIAMVTDVCELGDLWSVIYETELFQEEDGRECLPVDLIQFYVTGIVCGLDHMHGRQVIFRDLKPENILIDHRGYIKLIDCGLAKKLPYEEIDFLTEEMNVVYKAHSMCGTPGE